jgi:hypothetical protein
MRIGPMLMSRPGGVDDLASTNRSHRTEETSTRSCSINAAAQAEKKTPQ